LAERLQRLGAKVTLLIGPGPAGCVNKEVKVIHFKFFDELRNKITQELRRKQYDVVIHSAAVSDFAPVHKFKGKVDSHKSISLKLKPLPKIIRDIKYFAPQSILVMFKLESGVSDNILINRAKAAQVKAKAELIVANRLDPYQAFVIDGKGSVFPANSKNDLIKKLIKGIQSLCL
jgi:phosphopantothenoylcysteine decarboxylase/phosphopantothenate--cysteine ligase